jgi:hypothetical protein
MVRNEPERQRPGPVGRRITEQFNEWPEGDRAAAERAAGLAGTVAAPPSTVATPTAAPAPMTGIADPSPSVVEPERS